MPYGVRNINTILDSSSVSVIEIPNADVVYKFLDQSKGVDIIKNIAFLKDSQSDLGVIAQNCFVAGSETGKWNLFFSKPGLITVGIKRINDDINTPDQFSKTY